MLLRILSFIKKTKVPMSIFVMSVRPAFKIAGKK
jgi:hypothetical protein